MLLFSLNLLGEIRMDTDIIVILRLVYAGQVIEELARAIKLPIDCVPRLAFYYGSVDTDIPDSNSNRVLTELENCMSCIDRHCLQLTRVELMEVRRGEPRQAN